MTDAGPIDLTAENAHPGAHTPESDSDGFFARVSPVDPTGKPFTPEENEPHLVLPSITETLTDENVRDYMLGEKTAAEILGLSAPHLFDLAGVGLSRLDEGKLEEAREIFKMLVGLSPKFAPFRNLLGTAFLRLDMVDEAQLQYERAVELEPDYFEPHYNLAELMFFHERATEAKQYAAAALSRVTEKISSNAVEQMKRILILASAQKETEE